MRRCEPPGGSSRGARLTWRRQASAAQTVGSALIVIALAGGVAGAADPMLGPSRLPRADAARGVLVPGDEKLDTQLRAPASGGLPVPPRPPLVPVPLAALRGSKVHVLVSLASASPTDLALLARTGFKVERVSAEHRLARGWLRTKDLRALAGLALVRSIVPVRPGRRRAGSVTSEGDPAALGPQARATGFDGSGITVGVISDGIDHIAQSVVTGNVPAGTGVPGGFGCAAGSGDEGTAMLEIVHDLAPGATLLFSEGLSDKVSFVDSLTCLRNAGAQVIVDDVGFFDEPFFEDGMVAQAVRTAVQAGVSYHSAAGNDAQIHYGAAFQGVTDPSSGDLYHDFAASGAADTFDRMEIAPGQTLDCVLQWNDPQGASSNDYDLELWDLDQNPATLLEASTNVQSGTQNPLEEITPLRNPGGAPVHVGVRIKRVHGVDRQLGLFCFGGSNQQYTSPAGSIVGQPAISEAVAVGAIDIHDVGLNQIEPYSSQGPVTIYFPTLQVRPKPDLAGFDGVSTSICVSPSDCFEPFFGTSAAAPHVAAVAALLLSKNSCLIPAQVQQALKSGAIDILASGFDSVSGAGRLDALNVMTAPGPCDDGNPCTLDTCTPATGCQHTPRADGAPCPDGNFCNGTETCQGGTCTPGTPLVCDDGNACTLDSCDPATGCVFTFACDDGNPCTADTCDPTAGCQHAAVADATPCPDGNLCNGAETCHAGVCTAGAPLSCNDGAECTTNVCDPQLGCMYPLIEGFPGLACLCGADLAPASCGSTGAPAGVVRHFTRACRITAHASALKRQRRARQLVMQAAQDLGQATRGARRAARRGVLSPDCASALTAILGDARARAARLADLL
jgi:subtilisin family serine protease